MVVCNYRPDTHTTASKYVRLGWVYHDGADIVSVGLKGVHFLQSVVVEDTHTHVILHGTVYGGPAGWLVKPTEPVTIQLFLTTNLDARTGRSVTSKDLTRAFMESRHKQVHEEGVTTCVS